MIRIGVIGVGGMGSAHCAALAQLSDCAEFSALSDIRPEQARELAQKFRVVPFADYRDLLERVDAVVVATPPDLHREPAVAAAQAGKHVFVEKPLASTLPDCDAMITACEEAEVQLMVGQVLRFYPVHELGKQLVAEGVIGEIVHMEADYAGPFRGPRERPATWYGQVGGLMENGIHKVDLLNWFGGEALQVSSERGSFSGYADWEDYALALVRYRAGALGLLRWGGFMGARRSTDTIIDGTKGSLRLSIDDHMVYRKLTTATGWTELTPDGTNENAVERELRHFAECIERNTRCRVDGREGRRAVELVLASYKSADLGARVNLPLQY